MVTGDCIGAIAMTEPGAGSDLQGIRTTAVDDGDHWILNGSKTFITNGFNSDLVIVVAKTDKEAKGAHGISLLLVEAGTPGFEKGKKLKKMGMKAQDTSELFFEDCRVPKANVLGGDAGLNKGFYMLMKELPQERLLIADMAIASAEAVYEASRECVGTTACHVLLSCVVVFSVFCFLCSVFCVLFVFLFSFPASLSNRGARVRRAGM